MKPIYPLALAAALLASPASAQTSTQQTPPADTPAATGSPSAATPPAATTTPAPAPAPSVTPPASTTMRLDSKPMLTDDQAKAWIDKVVYSSDDKNLGEVANMKRDAAGHVTELHADIGGFLGLGETRVRLSPDQFKLTGDRVVLNVTAEQAKTLPKVVQ